MKNENEIKNIVCDLCKKKHTHVFYFAVMAEDEDKKVSLYNNGLYCKDCFKIIKTMPINPTPICEHMSLVNE